MINIVLGWLRDLPREWVVLIVSASPVAELRGALPLALYYGMSFSKAYWLSVLGNIAIIAPVLVLLEPVSSRLRKFKIWARFFDWLFERTKKRANTVQKYEALGLALFVAIPLPITGAWTGAVAASLFKIRFRYAFVAIAIGVMIAGLIVLTLCRLGIMSWNAVVH
ncbi:MAG: small multi-drug export protein [Candidatus Omnitrophota bacterium]